MSRILSIDYGSKRCGIAVTDSQQIIASGLKTVSNQELMPFLKEYVVKENINIIIIGLPKRLNNTLSAIESDIKKFIVKLQQQIKNIKIVRVDERFTSKLAFSAMIESGLSKKKRRNKSLVDEISATIILQSYLEQKNR